MKPDKFVKNNIALKATLSKSNLKPMKPQRINIQTIIKPKNTSKTKNKKEKEKNLFEPNEIIIKDKLNDSSFYSHESKSSIYNKNKKMSHKELLNTSNNSTYTMRKRKYKRGRKLKEKSKMNNATKSKSNSLESINNMSINSNNNIINPMANNNNCLCDSSSFSITNNSKKKKKIYSNYSSTSKDYSDNSSYYSDSSEDSNSNSVKEFKKIKYYSEMISEENELDNLTKKEVGIISSDEEYNNINTEENNDNENEKECTNNSDMETFLQENDGEEIEHILIEIYNKNISIITSQNSGTYVSKKLFETNTINKKKIKNTFKKQCKEKNLLVLKILSDKIKCLIEKCKEKIYEIDDIKKLYEQYIRDSNQRFCNSIGSSGLTTNSNSSYYNCSASEDENYYIRNNLLLANLQDENFCKGISQDLITQLINIKNTLKISSKEIENIFKYALFALRTANGKRAKVNIELMQLEQFNKVILNDDLISTLLIQIKLVFSKYKEDYIIQTIDQLQQECLYNKNAMTKFDNLLYQNLGVTNDENEINSNEINNNNNANAANENNEIISNNNNNGNINKKNNNNDNIVSNNEMESKKEITENNNNPTKEENKNIIEEKKDNIYINSNSSKKSPPAEKIKENKNDNDNNKDDNDTNVEFENIDDLVKFINDDSTGNNQKNSNKKNKKKNKKKKKKKNMEEEEKNDVEQNVTIKNLSVNEYINNESDDDIIIKNFKEDLIKNTIYNYNIIKIKPILPANYLLDKFSD